MKQITNRISKGKRYQISFHLLTTEDVKELFKACANELKYRKNNPDGAVNPESTKYVAPNEHKEKK